MLKTNPQNVKLVFKNFPLPNHKFAKQAAIAALAANEQGKFWEFHDKLFANFNRLGDQKINEIAVELGLDMVKFKNDMSDKSKEYAIVRDIQDGRAAGVRGTPTIFVNGILLKNRSTQGFQELINNQLKKK